MPDISMSMDDAILADIRTLIADSQVIDDEEILLESGSPKKLSKGNFHHVRPEVSQRNICYVDGGEGTLIDGGPFGLYLIRAYAIVIQKGRQKKSLSSEFNLSVKTGTNGIFETQMYSIRGTSPKILTMDSMDARLKEGVDRGRPGKLASLIRRISELELAKEALYYLESGDLIILDGTLETRFEEEKMAMEQLMEEATEKSVLVAAVSKSSNMITTKGKPVDKLFLLSGPGDSWYYHPVADAKGFELYLCKLHPKARHVLRLDMPKGLLADPGKVFSILAASSKDLSIPGYPYWLVKVDRLARVQDSEARYMRQKLLASVKGLESFIGRDVHSLLDSMH
jgi:hypothetical protein